MNYVDNLYNANVNSLYIIPMIENAIDEIGDSDINDIANYLMDTFYDPFNNLNKKLINVLEDILWDTLEEYISVYPKKMFDEMYIINGNLNTLRTFGEYYNKAFGSKQQLISTLEESNYKYLIDVAYSYVTTEYNIINEAFASMLFKELEKY